MGRDNFRDPAVVTIYGISFQIICKINKLTLVRQRLEAAGLLLAGVKLPAVLPDRGLLPRQRGHVHHRLLHMHLSDHPGDHQHRLRFDFLFEEQVQRDVAPESA